MRKLNVVTPPVSPAPEANLGPMDPDTRSSLVSGHLGLVHHMARQLARRISVDIDFDELVSAGTMGLMNAVDSFDAGRGLAFSTYAAPRIRGAILDELRRQDHVPRSIRRKIRDLGAAREELSRIHGNAPTDREMAEHLEVDLETFWRWQAEIEGVFLVPLDQPFDDDDRRSSTPALSLPGVTGDTIEDDINHQQEVEALREALLRLSERERIVLSLYYFEELKLHEIGAVLSLTESRVSQIHKKALASLRGEVCGLREAAA
ncbi:MAG TPA: FliA/WhiG family RNA polymerase sigma factor [Longimicrobiaceae bacterium]